MPRRPRPGADTSGWPVDRPRRRRRGAGGDRRGAGVMRCDLRDGGRGPLRCGEDGAPHRPRCRRGVPPPNVPGSRGRGSRGRSAPKDACAYRIFTPYLRAWAHTEPRIVLGAPRTVRVPRRSRGRSPARPGSLAADGTRTWLPVEKRRVGNGCIGSCRPPLPRMPKPGTISPATSRRASPPTSGSGVSRRPSWCRRRGRVSGHRGVHPSARVA